jgi:cytochrome c-type biogenesis protein CcmH/NrfG
MTSAKDRNGSPGATYGTESRASGTVLLNSLGWIRVSVGFAIAAAALVVIGVGAGVVLGRRAPQPSAGAGPAVRAVPGMPGGPAMSAELQSLARETQGEEAPTQKLLEFAHLALDQQHFGLAVPAYKRVLARDPKNAEALTHMGLILYSANHIDQALERIDQALRIDPKYAHAHWDRAYILYETKKDLGGAAKSLEAFLALIPQGQDTDRARALLAEIRRSGGTPKP